MSLSVVSLAALRVRRDAGDWMKAQRLLLLDRGPYVSFANCGLPYYVGDVIKDESKLLVANAALFQERFNIEVRTHNEALAIDRAAQEIEVKELSTGRIYRERYDALVLSPGAAALRPPLPGVDSPGIFVLRTIPDSRKIRGWISEKNAKSASSLVRVSSDWKWPRTSRIAAFP